MSDSVETVDVEVPGHPDGHVLINKSDFDADEALKAGDPKKKNYKLWVAPKTEPKKAEGAKTGDGTPVVVEKK